MERHIPFIIGALWVCALTVLLFYISKLVRPAAKVLNIQDKKEREIVTLGYRTLFVLVTTFVSGLIFFFPIAVVYKQFVTTHEKWKVFVIAVTFLGFVGLSVWHTKAKNDLNWQERDLS